MRGGVKVTSGGEVIAGESVVGLMEVVLVCDVESGMLWGGFRKEGGYVVGGLVASKVRLGCAGRKRVFDVMLARALAECDASCWSLIRPA
jgi:hypothetical protein